MAFDPNKIRLYVAMDLLEGGSVQLTREHAHYLGTVMCQKAGNKVYLFNGRDGEWRCDILHLDNKKAVVRAVSQSRPQIPPNSLALMFAPLKPSAIDIVVRTATELGVTDLQPVLTRRTTTQRTDLDRMASIAVEAAEQCERLDVPIIHTAIELETILQGVYAGTNIIFCDEGDDVPMLMDALDGIKSIEGKWAILIGPEAGFTPEERQQLQAMDNVIAVGLGPRILRPDTAAVAALTLYQATRGDF